MWGGRRQEEAPGSAAAAPQALWAPGSDLCAPAAGRGPGFGASQEAGAAGSWPGRHAAVATACVIFSRGAEPSLAWGHRHLPPAPPPPSLLAGWGWGEGALPTAARAERKVCAPRGRRCQEGAERAVFPFPESLHFTAKFPSRRLCPQVRASPRRSFPSLFSPRKPSEPGPAASSASGGDRGARSALPTVPGLRGSASPLPGAKLADGGAPQGDTAASRGTPNTIHTALMRL